MNNYQPIIGLEVHVETRTKTKMFCYCSADYFGNPPNSHTCPVCLGLPGAVPNINEQAIENCLKIGLALNCIPSKITRFERKNYFYPDLSKSYQISQYRWPLSVGGFLEITNGQGQKQTIRINRVHQEEDTGKLMHRGEDTMIDFNRSGVPLVEIVTEPDFHDVGAVRDYAKKLQQIFRYLGVSNADMEKGEMRLEANVSVRLVGETGLPKFRVELKNINSFRFMGSAIEYEIKRQIECLENGELIKQHTRGWDEINKQTFVQREKEEAHDYRYFPDPDLPDLVVTDDLVAKVKSQIPELPAQKISRYMEQLGLTQSQAEVLVDQKTMAEYFEKVVMVGRSSQIDPRQIANYLINQKADVENVIMEEIIKAISSKKIGILSDPSELESLAQKAIAENSKAVEDYKSGKTSAIQVLIGAIMRYSQGKADVEIAKVALEKILNEI